MARSHWKHLNPGDVVDVVAPGFACRPEELESGLAFLRSWKLVPRVSEGLLDGHFLHSQSDEFRLRDLRRALLAADSKAVWCLRGGYGANRLLPGLARTRRPAKPKLLIGLSDVTSLHVFLRQVWGWPTLHASLLDRLGAGKVPARDRRDLRELIFGGSLLVTHPGLRPMNEEARRRSSLSGELVGGNVIVLQSTLGTPWQIQTRGKILFFEDLGERGYRLDRVFEHFRQAGALMGCRGVVFGEFLGGDEPRGGNLVRRTLQRFADESKFPVWSGVPAGHGKRQGVLPLGTLAKIERRGQNFTLTLSSGGR